jgi:hypothetical protein
MRDHTIVEVEVPAGLWTSRFLADSDQERTNPIKPNFKTFLLLIESQSFSLSYNYILAVISYF